MTVLTNENYPKLFAAGALLFQEMSCAKEQPQITLVELSAIDTERAPQPYTADLSKVEAVLASLSKDKFHAFVVGAVDDNEDLIALINTNRDASMAWDVLEALSYLVTKP